MDINIRVPKILPSYVEKTDVEKLLDALKSKKSHKKTIERDILLVDLAIHTGLRRSELANLKVGDIDPERQVLIVRQGKGAKDRVIPLSTNTMGKLNTYIKGRDKTGSLFGLVPASISGKIRFFATKAGVDIHTHSLRDYFATSLSEKGATIREIQSLLGHANLVHTERYTLHTDKHLKDAIDLIDQEKSEIPTDKQNIVLAKSEQQPIVVIKAMCKPSVKVPNAITSDFHSHFIAYNDGNSPAIEVEIALFDKELKLFEANRNTVLRVKEEMEFCPNLRHLSEGKYLIICKYKDASLKSINQTYLPFELGKASMADEVYIAPRELQFEFNLSEKEQIQIFPKVVK